MLKIDNLENLCESFKQENSAIKKVLLLVDEKDYQKFVEAEKHAENEALLITVLPSANLAFADTDNFKFVNHLHFFVVKKINARVSYTNYVNTYKFTQTLLIELFKFLKLKSDNWQECIFKDFDFSQISFDPVTNLSRTYGFSISVPLKTPPPNL